MCAQCVINRNRPAATGTHTFIPQQQQPASSIGLQLQYSDQYRGCGVVCCRLDGTLSRLVIWPFCAYALDIRSVDI